MTSVRLNETQLRRVIRKIVNEQATPDRMHYPSGKCVLTVDIAADDVFGADAGSLRKGQNVTSYFADNVPQPMEAVVVNPFGPGGGNPEVKLTFIDEELAWEWWQNHYSDDVEEFEMAGGTI